MVNKIHHEIFYNCKMGYYLQPAVNSYKSTKYEIYKLTYQAKQNRMQTVLNIFHNTV